VQEHSARPPRRALRELLQLGWKLPPMEPSRTVDPTRPSTAIRGYRVVLLKIACVGILCAWIAIAAFIITLMLNLLPAIDLPGLDRWLWQLALVFFLTNVVVLATGPLVRCPVCSQMVLLNSWVPAHPAARRAPIVGYKAIVFDILRRNEFVCYHCGQAIRIGNPPSVSAPS